jgi:hypothetical protein
MKTGMKRSLILLFLLGMLTGCGTLQYSGTASNPASSPSWSDPPPERPGEWQKGNGAF